jgi:hypothetical protein
MPEGSDDRFTLRQIDQARGDLYAIHDEPEFLRHQLAWLPTRSEMLRFVLAGAGLAFALLEFLGRG